jgi:hypothetical protein
VNRLLTLCTLLFPLALRAQTPSAYNLTVHVVGSSIGEECAGHACEHSQNLRVTIDGQKYELQSDTLLAKGVIALGDYPGRLITDEHKPTKEFTREYTLQFPDGSTRNFQVIGVTE